MQKMEPERPFSFTGHSYTIAPKEDYSQETSILMDVQLERTHAGTLLTITEPDLISAAAAIKVKPTERS